MKEMQVLFIVLNDEGYLDDVLSAFVNVGIKGATILDSQGMGSAIAANLDQEVSPIGGDIGSFMVNHPYNKTIFAVIRSEVTTQKAVKAVKDVIGDVNKPGIGFMFTMPVNRVYGMEKINI